MRVIENRYNKKQSSRSSDDVKELKIICNECDSVLEIAPEDSHIGWLGARFVTCPCCGKETMVEQLDGITLTKDNIEFPKHFLRSNKNMGCKEVPSDFILSNIKESIMYFRRNKQEFAVELGAGDVSIHIYRYSGDKEYHIVVSRDWYETDIPFEVEDY